MKNLCNSLLLCGIVFFWVPTAANAQVATPTLLLAPVDWRFEAMPLPPRFAPKVKWTGFEEIRFAPGVFDNSSPNYFSYVIALSVNGTSAIDAAGIKDFLETYFRGLLPRVGQRKGLTVNASQIAAEIAPAQTKPKTNARCQGTVAIIDTFTDGRKTTLNVEADVLPQEALKKTHVLLLLSPRTRDSKIWKTLRGIRDKTIASSTMATAIPAATSRIPVAAASAVSVDPALQQRIDRLIQEKISLTHRGKWDERDERIGDIGAELCLIGEPAIEPLINVIKRARKSRHTFENEAVARGKIGIVLGRMGEPAVEPLLELLNNRDPAISDPAAHALARIGDPRYIQPLMKVLADRRRRTWFKYHTLVKLNRQGIQPLLYLLKNGDSESKGAAVGLLPLLGYRETIQPLMDTLKDRDASLRKSAAMSLERIKHTEILILQLESDSVMIRRYAARAISDPMSRIRSTREPLEKAMQDEDVLVRRAAAESLFIYHMPFPDLLSVRPFSIALKDPDRIVREKASNGLSRIRGRSNLIEFDRVLEGKEPLTEEDESVTGEAAQKARREELARVSKALNDYYVQRRKDQETDITRYKNVLKRSRVSKARENAAISLGQIANQQDVQIFIETLRDTSPAVQKAAVDALGNIGDLRAVPSLIRVLINRSKTLPVRQAAAGALGKIGDPRAVQPLTNASGEPNLSSAATGAIEQIQVSVEWAKEQEKAGASGSVK